MILVWWGLETLSKYFFKQNTFLGRYIYPTLPYMFPDLGVLNTQQKATNEEVSGMKGHTISHIALW